MTTYTREQEQLLNRLERDLGETNFKLLAKFASHALHYLGRGDETKGIGLGYANAYDYATEVLGVSKLSAASLWAIIADANKREVAN